MWFAGLRQGHAAVSSVPGPATAGRRFADPGHKVRGMGICISVLWHRPVAARCHRVCGVCSWIPLTRTKAWARCSALLKLGSCSVGPHGSGGQGMSAPGGPRTQHSHRAGWTSCAPQGGPREPRILVYRRPLGLMQRPLVRVGWV